MVEARSHGFSSGIRITARRKADGMGLELGLIFTFTIIAFGGAGLAFFMIWLRKRYDDSYRNNDSLKHA